MLNRVGKDAIGRATNSRRRATIGRRPGVEPLEMRALMTASIEPIANITSPQYQGYQVPVVAGTTHQQTYTVTSDNPGVKASIATGRFLTINLSHTAASSSDVTVNGSLTFQLFDDFTPITTAMITQLINGVTGTNTTSNVTAGVDFYDGKVFHRISPGFPTASDYIVQGGSTDGHGGATASARAFVNPYPDEFNQSVAFTGSGQLALANSGADTNDSQFFITTGAPNNLSYHHTIWGQLVAGQDILTQLTKVATETDPTLTNSTDKTYPINPVTINTATLSNVNPNGVVHIDTTVAPVGATANVTVTGTDVTDNSTASQTFQVNVSAQGDTPLRPFVDAYDPTLSLAQGQLARFQIFADSPTPDDPITYTVQGGYNLTTGAFTAIDTTKITASVDANGLVSVASVAGATGSTTLLIGVRDSTNRSGGSTLDVPGNYEYHTITVNLPVTTTSVPQRPLTAQALVDSVPGGVTPIQLSGTNADQTSTDPLTFAIVNNPTHGTISGFNAATGALNYTPSVGYAGPDAFSYNVTDPTSGVSSFVTTVKVNVTNASTGAVRFIANDGSDSTTTPGILVVTPNPRTDGGANTIVAAVVNGQVQVTVNGVVDAIEPLTGNVDRVVIYGSKANDNITIDPSLTTIATIDGGHGGKNVLKAGAGQTREHGWFGTNTLVQGSSENYQIGRTGRARFTKGTGTSNVIFLGQPGYFRTHLNRNRQLPVQTSGNYYKFASNGKTLVETANPYHTLNQQQRAARAAERKLRNAAGSNSGNGTTSTTSGTDSNQGGTISNGTSTGTGATVTTSAVKAAHRVKIAQVHPSKND